MAGRQNDKQYRSGDMNLSQAITEVIIKGDLTIGDMYKRFDRFEELFVG